MRTKTRPQTRLFPLMLLMLLVSPAAQGVRTPPAAQGAKAPPAAHGVKAPPAAQGVKAPPHGPRERKPELRLKMHTKCNGVTSLDPTCRANAMARVKYLTGDYASHVAKDIDLYIKGVHEPQVVIAAASGQQHCRKKNGTITCPPPPPPSPAPPKEGTAAYCLTAIDHYDGTEDESIYDLCQRWEDAIVRFFMPNFMWRRVWMENGTAEAAFGTREALASILVGAIEAARMNMTEFAIQSNNSHRAWVARANDLKDTYSTEIITAELLDTGISILSWFVAIPLYTDLLVLLAAGADILLRTHAEEKLHDLEDLFNRGLDTVYLSEQGRKIKGMMDLLQLTVDYEKEEGVMWNYIGRMFVFYVAISARTGIKFTTDDVLKDLYRMMDAIPDMQGFVVALANETFNKGTFEEISQALLLININSDMDSSMFVMMGISYGIAPAVSTVYSFGKLAWYKMKYPELVTKNFNKVQEALEKRLLIYNKLKDAQKLHSKLGVEVRLSSQDAQLVGLYESEEGGEYTIVERTRDGSLYIKVKPDKYELALKKIKSNIKKIPRESFLREVPNGKMRGYMTRVFQMRKLTVFLAGLGIVAEGLSEYAREQIVPQLEDGIREFERMDIAILNDTLETMKMWHETM